MLKTSEQINELATALSLAQGEIEGAKKENVNPAFRSKYADLASCWDAIRAPFAKHGLSLFQGVVLIEHRVKDDEVELRTCLASRLIHKSGQWMETLHPLKPVKDDPQGLGSAITYARRYELCAMAGVAPEDDDGNSVSGKTQSFLAAPAAKARPSGPAPLPATDGPLPAPMNPTEFRFGSGQFKGQKMTDVAPEALVDYMTKLYLARKETSDKGDAMPAGLQAAIGAYERLRRLKDGLLPDLNPKEGDNP